MGARRREGPLPQPQALRSEWIVPPLNFAEDGGGCLFIPDVAWTSAANQRAFGGGRGQRGVWILPEEYPTVSPHASLRLALCRRAGTYLMCMSDLACVWPELARAVIVLVRTAQPSSTQKK